VRKIVFQIGDKRIKRASSKSDHSGQFSYRVFKEIDGKETALNGRNRSLARLSQSL